MDLSKGELHAYVELEQRIDRLQTDLSRARPEMFDEVDWLAAVALTAKTDPLAKRLATLVAERRRMLAKSSGRFTVVKRLARCWGIQRSPDDRFQRVHRASGARRRLGAYFGRCRCGGSLEDESARSDW